MQNYHYNTTISDLPPYLERNHEIIDSNQNDILTLISVKILIKRHKIGKQRFNHNDTIMKDFLANFLITQTDAEVVMFQLKRNMISIFTFIYDHVNCISLNLNIVGIFIEVLHGHELLIFIHVVGYSFIFFRSRERNLESYSISRVSFNYKYVTCFHRK